jgi:hypothetical protein
MHNRFRRVLKKWKKKKEEINGRGFVICFDQGVKS